MSETVGVPGLAGAVVLVTGAGKGIGAAVARGFAASGAKLVLHYRESADEARALASELTALTEVALVAGDITEAGAPERLVHSALERFGRLDVLVNNAGAMVGRKQLDAVDDAFIDAVFDLNARSVVHVCKAAAPALASTGGCIVNVSSISARTGGSPGSSLYSSAKGFVSTLTRSLAAELAEQGVRVNAVSPGTVTTDFHARYSTPEKLERTRRGIPLQRLAGAEDCVGAFLFLASPLLAGYVTGQVIEVNGGQLLA